MRVHIAKCLILNDSDEMPIAQKSANKKYNPLCQSTPAGHIEEGESAYDAALREAKEETGLDVTIICELAVDIRDSPKVPGKEIQTTYFLCRTSSTNVILQKDEFQTCEWI